MAGCDEAEGGTPVGSSEYPAKIFFHTPTPETFIDDGYTAVRLQKRTGVNGTFADVVDIDPVFFIEGIYNYYFIDPFAVEGDFYRPVVYDPTGVEVDIPQPATPAVDTSYEQLMTVQEFKDIYLWGEDPAFIDDVGRYQPDYAFAHSIRYGIAKVERMLSIRLLPKKIVGETHDWLRDGGQSNSMFLWLDEFPVRSVASLTLRPASPGVADFTFPAEWLRVSKADGRLAVTPSTNLTSGFSMHAFSTLSGVRHLPDAFVVDYFAGFDPADLPADLKEVVGKEAAFGPLNVGGDLIGGAGLAGTSISMDGLSQSVTTTNSSTNAGFGARLIQYEKELRAIYKILLPSFKGIRMRVA